MDVTALYAVDEKSQTLYYQAATTPATRDIYALSIKPSGKAAPMPVKLTEGEGTHAARFSKDAKRMIDCFQSFDTPNTYTLYTLKGVNATKVRLIQDPSAILAAWKEQGLPEPELLRIPNSHGQELEAMLLTPNSYRPQAVLTPNPLVVMHYSGPASQRVLNRWRKRFEYALVEQGYAVLIVDPRGSDCKGRAWRNETYMSLGQKEAEDLIAAANEIAKRPEIDGSRMAILGWSYGGYETLYTMSQKNHPFKAGIAIAPVTDWRLYDSAYTERYMRRPQVNPRGYEEASLMNKAAELSGAVLIIHGTGDDNVHVQHTMQYINALVEADKQFEMQLYPDDNHHLRQGNNAKHMHERILRFLHANL
jgi:dipeptidyl-peptidase-4